MATRHELERRLADIDRHVESIAQRNDSDNDAGLLAYAVLGLVKVVRDMLGDGEPRSL